MATTINFRPHLFFLFSILLISCNPGPEQNRNEPSAKISESDLSKKIKGNSIVLVDFGATWCMPCRRQAAILDPFIKEEVGKVTTIKLDADSNRVLAGKMQVTVLPTMFVFKNGTQIWRGEGLTPLDTIKRVINGK